MAGKIRFYPEECNSLNYEQRKERKEKLLRQSVKYMYDHSPEYYQLRFKECGATPSDIRTIEDLRKLPIFMDKDRERQSMEASLEKYGHPFGLHVCCDPADIISTGGTSGTTGHPTYPYSQTREDREFIADATFFMHKLLGLGRGDRAFFLYPLGVYATSAILPGIEKAGILPLPIDIRLGPQPAMEMVKWTRPTYWYTGSAIVEFFADLLKNKLNIDPRMLGFKCLLLTGEAGCGIPELKKKVEDAFGCRWYDWWGPSLLNIALSCDSDTYYGLHNFAEDWDISSEDLVDPVTKEPVEIKDGAVGEMVGTHLQKKASPYLRYATGDIVELYTSECPACGFKGFRLKVIGRADDMLTVKGVNVFAGAIHAAIQRFAPRITGHMRVIKESPSPRITELKMIVEYGEGMKEQVEQLGKEIKATLKSELRISPKFEWVAPNTLERPIRKPILFDKRYEKK